MRIWESCYKNSIFRVLSSVLDQGTAEHIENELSSKSEEILQLSKSFYSGQNNEMTKKEIIKRFSNFQFLLSNTANVIVPKTFDSKHEKKEDDDDEEMEITLNDCLGVQTSIKGYEYLDEGEINGSKIDIDDLKGFIAKKDKHKVNRKSLIKINSMTLFSSPIKKNTENGNGNNLGNSIEKKASQRKKEKEVSQKTILEKTKNAEKSEEQMNKSTLDTQMGFAISKVKSVYPNRFLKEHITNLDFVIGTVQPFIFFVNNFSIRKRKLQNR